MLGAAGGGGGANHCSLQAVLRSYDHIDHIEVRDGNVHARFNDALVLEGESRIDESIQVQVSHGHIVPVGVQPPL